MRFVSQQRLREWGRPLVPYVPSMALAGWLAYKALSSILQKAGHVAVPLDDAFIHFQFARNIAHGHPFVYAPGHGYVAGATSLLWPMVLAPFYWLGVRGLDIIWVAWFLGFAALAALSVETYRLAERLTGRSTALGAGLAVAVFPAFIWFAASGMETVPFAWAMVRSARLTAQWLEAAPEQRSKKLFRQVLVMGLVAPWLRPEGAILSLAAAAALVAHPMSPAGRLSRWRGLAVLAGPGLSPALNWTLTGQAASNTTISKWLLYDPYLSTIGALWAPITDNLRLLFTSIIDGGKWSALFVPSGAAPFALLGLAGIAYAGWKRRRPWTAAMVGLVALGMLATTTYETFLWNRLRYLWPFAPGWFIGGAAAALALGDLAGLWNPRWKLISPVLSGAMAGALLGNLSWTYSDLAKSARAIDKQQVTLGKWARKRLPPGALIGVNDTGAIAYMSGHPTFDVVGLTTQGEARYWVAGAGSRFEHYERLYKKSPEKFPSFFIVYPGWMNCRPVLSEELHRETVVDQSILGGTTMVAYRARVDLLGSGNLPLQPPVTGEIIDELDVADLESERAHGYLPPVGKGWNNSNRVMWGVAEEDEEEEHAGGPEREQPWADGGRTDRIEDRFRMHGTSGESFLLVSRLYGSHNVDVTVEIIVNGKKITTGRVHARRMVELSGPVVPPSNGTVDVLVRRMGAGTFASLHYWLIKLDRSNDDDSPHVRPAAPSTSRTP